MDDLIADFLTETRVDFDRLRNALARVEAGAPLGDEVGEMLRGAHALRAAAGSIGLARVSDLAGAVEASLERLRGGAPSAPEIVRNLHRSVERLSRLTAVLAATGAEPTGGDPDLLAALSEDGEARHRQERLSAEIAHAPIEPADPWAAIERLVASTAAQMGKNITLTIEQSARDLPPAAVHAAAKALALVVRFACVYGVELEVLRHARGKRAAGAIRISSLRVDAQAAIAVSDDGAGLDLERLRQRAIALGRVTRAEAATLKDADAAQLVFLPGVANFGERDASTGLDIAKASLEAIGGAIEVNSLRGRGATFLIRAPLNAAPEPLLAGGHA